MKRTTLCKGILLLSVIFINNYSIQENFPELKGSYLGQKPPGKTPEIFAPGIVNTEAQNHSCVAISPDEKEMYWSLFSTIDEIRQERIWFSRMINGSWTMPQVTPFSGEYRESCPRFSYDGKQFFFTSLRPTDENDTTPDANTWTIEISKSGWSHPKLMSSPVNTEFQEWCPTIAKNGNLYFMFRKKSSEFWNIYFSEYKSGKYETPEKLSNAVNSDYVDGFPFIHPDEKYLIFYSERPGGSCEEAEMYISFRSENGSWSKAIDMGPLINSGSTRFAGLSPDGKYFFFSNRKSGKENIYWIDAKIINELKPEKFK